MPIPTELYTTDGVVTGLLDAPSPLADLLESGERLRLLSGRMTFVDGSAVDLPESDLPIDDVLLAVPDQAEVPVHATWHDVGLALGPWVVNALLPTQPGFDPGRSLTRPGGTFLLLSEVRVAHRDAPGRVLASHERLLVNRYTVEAATAEMMLGHFFPGAVLEVGEPATTAS
jgi:hypothetical protein